MLSEPEFYGDLVHVYKFRKIYACNDFSTQFHKIIFRYIKIGYNINVIRQTACMVVMTDCMHGSLPNNGWYLCFPLWLHAGWSGLRLYDGSGGSGLKTFTPIGPTGVQLFFFFFFFFFVFFFCTSISVISCCRVLISVFVWFLCSRRCCTDETNVFRIPRQS